MLPYRCRLRVTTFSRTQGTSLMRPQEQMGSSKRLPRLCRRRHILFGLSEHAQPCRSLAPLDLPKGEVPDVAIPPLGCSLYSPLPEGLRAVRLGEPRPALDARGEVGDAQSRRVPARARGRRRRKAAGVRVNHGVYYLLVGDCRIVLGSRG